MSAARGFLGSGDLYIRRMVAGVFGPWQGKYECNKFEIKPNVETKEMTSKGRDTYGQVIESVALPQPADLTVEMSEVNRESLAIAMMGTAAAISQTAGTMTDQVIAAADVVLDAWIPLPKHHWTGNPTVKNSGATVTYVQGEDYIVDKVMGWIKPLATGAIVGGAELKVTTTYGLSNGTEIKGMTDSQLRVQFRLEGKNFVDGLAYRVTVYEAVIAADSAFDFLQDDFAKVELPGRMKTPVGYNEPFIIVLDEAVA